MRTSLPLLIALSFAVAACTGRGAEDSPDSLQLPQQPADQPATASRDSVQRPADSTARIAAGADSTSRIAAGKEPGTIPATPTPTVTTENALAAMRLHLQRLDTASAASLQAKMKDHAKVLGELLTTMGVEVQAVTSSGKNAWVALSDTVDGDLDRLALAEGEELRTTFRAHRTRVLRLLDAFRVLVPARPSS